MGLRFQKRISLGGGFSLNLGKRSASISAGGRGHRVTVGTHGAHASMSLPGTGISYRTGSARGAHHRKAKRQAGALSMLLYLVLILWVIGYVSVHLGIG